MNSQTGRAKATLFLGREGQETPWDEVGAGGGRHTHFFECVKHIDFYLDIRNPRLPTFDLKISKV